MAITVATVTKNVCLNRHRKADSISFRSCIRTLASLTHHMAQKSDRATAVQSVHNVPRTKAGLQIAVTTEPYIKMSRMSNQRKAEFVGDIFYMRSFWGVHGEISAKTCFIQVGMIC
jgi:carboxypeptidase C (cathepsin A)